MRPDSNPPNRAPGSAEPPQQKEATPTMTTPSSTPEPEPTTPILSTAQTVTWAIHKGKMDLADERERAGRELVERGRHLLDMAIELDDRGQTLILDSAVLRYDALRELEAASGDPAAPRRSKSADARVDLDWLQSIEALLRPGEFTTYGDLAKATGHSLSAGPAVARRMTGTSGWTAPWRVLAQHAQRNGVGSSFKFSPRWSDEEGHDAAWAQAQLEAEGVRFDEGGLTDRTHYVTATVLMRRAAAGPSASASPSP